MPFCKRCNDYVFAGEECRCQPFRCGNEDYSGENREEWKIIHAKSFESAAIVWAKRYDEDDHTLLDGDSIVCEVIDKMGLIKKFKCTGYMEPVYEAEEIKEGELT